ncbi:MAG: thermonuclease family protein [Planctomycetota bacterium]|jgi:endonuclease YncB( thermonuclease family)|nr:thermonuclease family protein [Planctomycetota bacterium]
MKTLFRGLVTAALLLYPVHAADWSGLCVSVADGDTITVLSADDWQVRVRLYGIDAPERKQPYGTVARRSVAAICYGKTVGITELDVDRYGRVVALVEVDGVLVNRALVDNGMAWVYEKYCKQPECDEWLELEARARKERRGLWGGSEPPVPPWEWRRRK